MGYLQNYEALTEWNNAQAASGFESLPDGNYIASVDAVKLIEGDSARNIADALNYELTVLDGECKGRRFQHRRYIRDAKSFSWIKKEMIDLQVNIPNNPNDMAIALQPAVGKVISVRVTNNTVNGKTYMNVYINGLSALPNGQTNAPYNQARQVQPVSQMQNAWTSGGPLAGGYQTSATAQVHPNARPFIPEIQAEDIPF